jgi:hypothetical protein
MKKYATVGITTLMAVVGIGLWAWANIRLMPSVVHTAEDIAAAHRLFQIVPMLGLVLAIVGTAITAFSWKRHSERVYRAVSILPVVALIVGAVLAQGTVVEMAMFSPIDEARFVAVAAASFLEPEHLVLGVSIGGEAKAYPVGMMTYHHIVNDRLAGEPYVATY